jgi:hypothetical protein
MNSKRMFFLLSGLIGLSFIGLVGATFGINNVLGKQGGDLVTTKAVSSALGQEQISLVKAKKDITKYNDLEKIVHTVVPEDKDQAEAVRELVKIADTYHDQRAFTTYACEEYTGRLSAGGYRDRR